MPGVLVLQGGGAFTANDDLDRRILPDRGIERIVILPTADAYEQPNVLVASALEWGARIGVIVEPLMVLTRSQADDAAAALVATSSAVFLAGDSSIHLRSVLKDTPLLAAIVSLLEGGGTVIAAGASAAALCDPMTDERGGAFAFGLGIVPGLALITGVESWPKDRLDRAHALATTPVVDLPTGSALVRTDTDWERVGSPVVHGELPL